MNQTTFATKDCSQSKMENTSDLDQLVTIRSQGNQAPLFCIHPSGGDVGIFRKLVTRLAPNRPVLGIQSRMLCGAKRELSSLHEIASTYAEIIKAKQPCGAISIIGFSLGGFIATLMAEELCAAGRTVSFLGLIDSNPSWTAADETTHRELCLRLEQVFTKFQSIGMMNTKPLETVQRDVSILIDACLRNPSVSSEEVMSRIDSMGYVPSGSVELGFLTKFTSSFLAHCSLLADFEPPQIDCPLHLWWPSESVDESDLGSSLWENRASSNVIESIVEGSHYSIMRGPTVRQLASEIDAALDAADAVGLSVAEPIESS